MFNFLIRRFATSLLTVFGIATLIFLVIHIIPGDPAYVILGDRATPQAVEAVRERLGLDRPLIQQYIEWLQGILRFDFGNSLYDQREIGPELGRRMGRTLELIMVSLFISTLLGIPLGIIAAARGKIEDFLISTGSIIGLSLPSLVVGPILALVFGVQLRLFPTSGFISITRDFSQHLRYLALPTLSLTFFSLGVITRMTRSCVMDNIKKDYVLTAKAKGLNKKRVLYKHILKNSMIPIITLIGTRIGVMLAGTVITESLFNWPGMSTFLLNAAFRRDYPIIQGVVLLVAIIFVFLNFFVDVILGFFDPRIKYN